MYLDLARVLFFSVKKKDVIVIIILKIIVITVRKRAQINSKNYEEVIWYFLVYFQSSHL